MSWSKRCGGCRIYCTAIRKQEEFKARHRTGGFRSVEEFKTAIMEYLEGRNANPKPYHWTATPEAILAKVAKAEATLGTLH